MSHWEVAQFGFGMRVEPHKCRGVKERKREELSLLTYDTHITYRMCDHPARRRLSKARSRPLLGAKAAVTLILDSQSPEVRELNVCGLIHLICSVFTKQAV